MNDCEQQLKERVKILEEALRSLEFSYYSLGYLVCLQCGSREEEGHSEDCPIGMALKSESLSVISNEIGNPTDEANPNGSVYGRLKWWKDQCDLLHDQLDQNKY